MRKIALLIMAVSIASLSAQPTNSNPRPSAEISPTAVLATMKLVADWQLTNASPTAARYKENTWTYGALYTGIMALDGIAGTSKYHDAMVAIGKKFDWKPGPRIYHADDHCVGQTYLELYFQDHDPAMLQPIKERFDYVLAHSSTNQLDESKQSKMDRWWWCDALFMGPPTWARMFKATGDKRYLDFL